MQILLVACLHPQGRLLNGLVAKASQPVFLPQVSPPRLGTFFIQIGYLVSDLNAAATARCWWCIAVTPSRLG